jgi:hypothetical protein
MNSSILHLNKVVEFFSLRGVVNLETIYLFGGSLSLRAQTTLPVDQTRSRVKGNICEEPNHGDEGNCTRAIMNSAESRRGSLSGEHIWVCPRLSQGSPIEISFSENFIRRLKDLI